jgi:hypothetical protein
MNLIKFQKTIFLVIFLISNIYLYSQIDCPTGQGTWTSSSTSVSMGVYGDGGSVNFQKRSNGNNYEINIDWNSFQNDSDFMPDNALKKMLESEVVESVVGPYPAGYSCYVYVYFKRTCTAEVSMVLELDETGRLECCDEGAPIPNYYQKMIEGNYHYFYKISKKVPCGEKCCRRVYFCQRVYDVIKERTITTVSNPTTESVTSCSGDSEFVDCETGEFIPCEDGSCDGYW